MTKRRISLAITALAVLAGCDSPTSSEDGNREHGELTASRDEVTATSLDAVVPVAFSRGGARVTDFRVEVLEERRWLEEAAVLDEEELANGRLIARAPGRVRLRISAERSSPTEISILVAPPAPTVLFRSDPSGDVLEPGEPLHLRGYRLDEIAPEDLVANSDISAAIIHADSASLTFSLSFGTGDTCEGAGAITLGRDAQSWRISRNLPLPRPDEVRLDAGDYAVLTEQQINCLLLPADDEARYALSLFDTSQQESARDGIEMLGGRPVDVTIWNNTDPGASLETAPEIRASSLPVKEAPGSIGDTDFRVQTSSSPITERRTPFYESEIFTLDSHGGGPAAEYKVRHVYDDWLVFATLADEEDFLSDEVQEMINSAFRRVLDYELPYLQAAFGEDLPTTNEAHGQLLILGHCNFSSETESCAGGSGIAATTARGEDVRSRVEIDYHLPEEDLVGLLVHEIAHTFQMHWLWGHGRSLGATNLPNWHIEGGAKLLENEARLRMAGVPFGENVPISTAPAAVVRSILGDDLEAPPINELYRGSAGYLRDLVERLVVHTETPYEEALRAVSRGIIEGWFGIDLGGVTHPGGGLEARMRAYFGQEWDAAESVLLWQMSQQLDDHTPNPFLQNHLLHDSGGLLEGADPNRTWSASRKLDPGHPAPVGIFIRPGANATVLIDPAERGASYKLEAPASVEWMISRY